MDPSLNHKTAGWMCVWEVPGYRGAGAEGDEENVIISTKTVLSMISSSQAC